MKSSTKEEEWINKIYSRTDERQYLTLLFNSSCSVYDEHLTKVKGFNLLKNQSENAQNILAYGVRERESEVQVISASFFGELFLTKILNDDTTNHLFIK